MKKRGAIVAGFVAAAMGLGTSTASAVDSFTFDADGAGGAAAISNVASFDYAPGNALALGGGTAIANFVGGGSGEAVKFDSFIQSKLVALLDSNNNNVTPTGLVNGNFEITVVSGFREAVTFAFLPAGVATFGITGETGAAPNFFEIYFDGTPDADDLAGTGFNNGTLILSGLITGGSSVFAVNGGGAGTPLDGFGGTDNYPTIDSVTGTGSTQLTAQVTYTNSDFFVDSLVSINLSIVNSAQNLNFSQVDPSAAFALAAGGAAPTTAGAGIGVASLGAINGLSGGPDVQFQIDATQSFTVTENVIPEPATAGLGLMGLTALAMGLRRRRQA